MATLANPVANEELGMLDLQEITGAELAEVEGGIFPIVACFALGAVGGMALGFGADLVASYFD